MLIIVAIAVSIVLFVSFELYQICFVNHGKSNKKLPEMTHIEAIKLIKDGKEYMFADDSIIDIKDFKLSHPGGTYFIQNSIGQDTVKYMIGCSSYEGKFNPYTHSEKALSLLNRLAIASIPYPLGYLESKDSKVDQSLMEFVVAEKKPLNDHTFLMFLKSDFFKLSAKCKNLSWFGKHFKVILNKKFTVVRRYYSSLFIDLFD